MAFLENENFFVLSFIELALNSFTSRELGLLRKRPVSVSSPRCLKKKPKTDQTFSYLIIIDFESTCWENDKLIPQEIIEFPAVLLNTCTGQIEDEFHYYLQPSEHPILSDFCQQLTGISQVLQFVHNL
ncbi:eri1 exoribonuclease 2-like [Plakobranchus ocellatus]|uniref:Eri1 exoribonuclease 2-like n=1 Tax=Plakobranchus ocellatus TaxID=259542 RepID=A0AAV4DCQ9_9GAST|nr:eri1 exoribonuclease 2-like [Plakobranchus ocellatus]